MRKTISAIALFLIFTVLPVGVFAQTPDTPVPAPMTAKNKDNTTLQSCFDYYRFGSVPVVLSTETVRLAQGATLNIKGRVTNQNSYRVDDITVYGKVYYKKNFDKSSFGPDIIQMMPLAEGLALEPGEEKSFTYSWPIPASAETGNYQIAAFVVSHDRFNMAGLSFTSDVVGSLLNFSIVGETMGSVRFDNTKTILNNTPFHGAIFPPKSDVLADGTPLTSTIANTTARPFIGKVHWKVYSWDNMNDTSLLEEVDTPVTVSSGASTTLTFKIKDSSHTVYYVLGELLPEGAKVPVSMLQVRYIQTGASAQTLARIGFLGVTQYPAEKDNTKAFVCVHSTGSHAVKDSKVVLTVTSLDPVKKLLNKLLRREDLATFEYAGDIPGQMSAVSAPFTNNSNNFSVTATLYENDKKIDSVTIDYPCVASDTNQCKTSIWDEKIIVQAALAVIIIVVIVTVLYRRRKNETIIVTE